MKHIALLLLFLIGSLFLSGCGSRAKYAIFDFTETWVTEPAIRGDAHPDWWKKDDSGLIYLRIIRVPPPGAESFGTVVLTRGEDMVAFLLCSGTNDAGHTEYVCNGLDGISLGATSKEALLSELTAVIEKGPNNGPTTESNATLD